MRIRILGVKPEFDDGTWKKMKKVWDACKDAEVDPPQEVEEFFGDEGPVTTPSA